MKSLKHAKTNWHQIFFYVNYYFSHRISNVTSISDTFSLTNNRLCIQITDWTFRNLCVFDSVFFVSMISPLVIIHNFRAVYFTQSFQIICANLYLLSHQPICINALYNFPENISIWNCSFLQHRLLTTSVCS